MSCPHTHHHHHRHTHHHHQQQRITTRNLGRGDNREEQQNREIQGDQCATDLYKGASHLVAPIQLARPCVVHLVPPRVLKQRQGNGRVPAAVTPTSNSEKHVQSSSKGHREEQGRLQTPLAMEQPWERQGDRASQERVRHSACGRARTSRAVKESHTGCNKHGVVSGGGRGGEGRGRGTKHETHTEVRSAVPVMNSFIKVRFSQWEPAVPELP